MLLPVYGGDVAQQTAVEAFFCACTNNGSNAPVRFSVLTQVVDSWIPATFFDKTDDDMQQPERQVEEQATIETEQTDKGSVPPT